VENDWKSTTWHRFRSNRRHLLFSSTTKNWCISPTFDIWRIKSESRSASAAHRWNSSSENEKRRSS
jgi:GTPase_EngA: ribosome-associated GTPase EngA